MASHITGEMLVSSIAGVMVARKLPGIKIICIDGFYGAGKTTFANLLCTRMIQLGESCLVISTDDFMKYSRQERMQYKRRYFDHPNWYDIPKLRALLYELKNHCPEEVSLVGVYNHGNGELDRKVTFKPCELDCIIIEGVYGLHASLRAFIELGIFLKANHQILQSRVMVRDQTERGLHEALIASRYWIINGEKYQNYAARESVHADLIIDNSEGDILAVGCGTELGETIVALTKRDDELLQPSS